MTTIVGEYLGQSTDVDYDIVPVNGDRAMCPFNDRPCIKIVKENYSKPPVCGVRHSTRASVERQFYITCEHRLISTDVRNMSQYQKQMLLHVAKVIFNPNIAPNQLAFRQETPINTGVKSKSKADYILAVVDENLITFGPRRMIIEVQGGGETSNTGAITDGIVGRWEAMEQPTNIALRTSTSKASPIPVNAWRRSQQQLIAKGKTASASGYGFAILFGEYVFDYLVTNVLPEIANIAVPSEAGWNTAFIVFSEKRSNEIAYPAHSIPLSVNLDKSIFTTMDRFISAVQHREIMPDLTAFNGKFSTLDGREIILGDSGHII